MAAACAADTSAPQSSEAIERCKDAGPTTPDADLCGWHRVEIRFADYPTAHRTFRAYLAHAL
ncbi:hypothetical protein ACFYNY_11315 [Streptomyces sp. NPDC006530]|uniref:hypothetical protein n=1 Tax=Streptomyces sp. NPDC006530 TaxID=3364750 RepID=UPI00368983DD